MREQEVLNGVRRLVVVTISRIGLLDCLLHIRSWFCTIALLSWPTKCSGVDNTIKTILLTSMAGFVLRLRLRGGLNAGVRQRASNSSCSATKTY
jgi:hypothetical protein